MQEPTEKVKVRNKTGFIWTIFLLIINLALLASFIVRRVTLTQGGDAFPYHVLLQRIEAIIRWKSLCCLLLGLTLWKKAYQVVNWAAAVLLIVANWDRLPPLPGWPSQLHIIFAIFASLPFFVPMKRGLRFGRPYSIVKRPALPSYTVSVPSPTIPMVASPSTFVAPGALYAQPSPQMLYHQSPYQGGFTPAPPAYPTPPYPYPYPAPTSPSDGLNQNGYAVFPKKF